VLELVGEPEADAPSDPTDALFRRPVGSALAVLAGTELEMVTLAASDFSGETDGPAP
jgi:hypothetical protein